MPFNVRKSLQDNNLDRSAPESDTLRTRSAPMNLTHSVFAALAVHFRKFDSAVSTHLSFQFLLCMDEIKAVV